MVIVVIVMRLLPSLVSVLALVPSSLVMLRLISRTWISSSSSTVTSFSRLVETLGHRLERGRCRRVALTWVVRLLITTTVVRRRHHGRWRWSSCSHHRVSRRVVATTYWRWALSVWWWIRHMLRRHRLGVVTICRSRRLLLLLIRLFVTHSFPVRLYNYKYRQQ